MSNELITHESLLLGNFFLKFLDGGFPLVFKIGAFEVWYMFLTWGKYNKHNTLIYFVCIHMFRNIEEF